MSGARWSDGSHDELPGGRRPAHVVGPWALGTRDDDTVEFDVPWADADPPPVRTSRRRWLVRGGIAAGALAVVIGLAVATGAAIGPDPADTATTAGSDTTGSDTGGSGTGGSDTTGSDTTDGQDAGPSTGDTGPSTDDTEPPSGGSEPAGPDRGGSVGTGGTESARTGPDGTGPDGDETGARPGAAGPAGTGGAEGGTPPEVPRDDRPAGTGHTGPAAGPAGGGPTGWYHPAEPRLRSAQAQPTCAGSRGERTP